MGLFFPFIKAYIKQAFSFPTPVLPFEDMFCSYSLFNYLLAFDIVCFLFWRMGQEDILVAFVLLGLRRVHILSSQICENTINFNFKSSLTTLHELVICSDKKTHLN